MFFCPFIYGLFVYLIYTTLAALCTLMFLCPIYPSFACLPYFYYICTLYTYVNLCMYVCMYVCIFFLKHLYYTVCSVAVGNTTYINTLIIALQLFP
jgi:hypothetical protein